MERKEAAEQIFEYIRSVGYKPYDIEYGTGYFIFEMGKDSVVYFKVKGCYGWRFAMWINTNKEELFVKEESKEYPAIQFFAQHIDNIDKFKPSRSYFLAEYTLDDIERNAHCTWFEIKNIIGMIKNHPLIAHSFDRHGTSFVKSSFLLDYFGSKFYEIRSKINNIWEDWMPITWIRLKLFLCAKRKIIKSINIRDDNDENFTCYPRWKVNILFTEDSTNEAECKYLNRWFKRVANNVDLRLNRVGIDYSYDYTLNNDIRIPN